MNFRGARSRSRRAEATIEITSLIDVVFLLLIFLLVTTTFKKHEYAFVIELPTSSNEQVTVSTDKTTVFVTQDGDLFLLEVGGDSAGLDPPSLDKSSALTAEALEARLAQLKADNPDASIAVRGEKATSYQSFMGVIGLLQKVGFSNIWFPYEFDPEP
ncbi:MAG: biopolymer transport protein ExbD [Myxococcota bacterium]|jgi:biopolymer transport protein ExbD